MLPAFSQGTGGGRRQAGGGGRGGRAQDRPCSAPLQQHSLPTRSGAWRSASCTPALSTRGLRHNLLSRFSKEKKLHVEILPATGPGCSHTSRTQKPHVMQPPRHRGPAATSMQSAGPAQSACTAQGLSPGTQPSFPEHERTALRKSVPALQTPKECSRNVFPQLWAEAARGRCPQPLPRRHHK